MFDNLKSERANHQSVVVGSNIYLVGGSRNEICLAECETILDNKKYTKYNLTIPRMHYERRYFRMCLFAGCIFVRGGEFKNYQDLDKCKV